LPARSSELTHAQRAFLHLAAGQFETVAWNETALQSSIFTAARLTPLDQPAAFKAIYRVLLDRQNGPKAGNLLSFLDPAFVKKRFREVPFDKVAFWAETSLPFAELKEWISSSELQDISWNTDSVMDANSGQITAAVLEVRIHSADGKIHARRLTLGSFSTAGEYESALKEALASLEAASGRKIPEARG